MHVYVSTILTCRFHWSNPTEVWSQRLLLESKRCKYYALVCGNRMFLVILYYMCNIFLQGEPWCFHKSELDYCSSDADCGKYTACNMAWGTGVFFLIHLEYACCYYLVWGVCSPHINYSMLLCKIYCPKINDRTSIEIWEHLLYIHNNGCVLITMVTVKALYKSSL